MRKIISAILVTGITLGGFSLALADDADYRGKHQGKYCKHGAVGDYSMGHHKKDMEQRMQRMLHRLDLDDEQTSKVSAVFDQHRTQLNSLRSKMKSNRMALRENMQADTHDMALIEKLAKAQGELKTQKILLKAKVKSEINKILNKEQREKIKTIRAKRHQKSHGKYRHHD